MVAFTVSRVETAPFVGQKPGTSGLRKKVKVFMQPHYLENFVQPTFYALSAEKVKRSGATLVVSEDGRYYSKDAIQIIVKMTAANGVRRVWVGQNGLLSTPAVSAVIRERTGHDGSRPSGAFILTASQNPGGPHEDFGIKYNMENGGRAPESITNKIYENTKTIKEYFIAEDLPNVDITALVSRASLDLKGRLMSKSSIQLRITYLWSILIAKIFYCLIQSYDALHGVAGAYARRIFVEELGANDSSLLNCTPEVLHAQINAERFFVTPSDSVAIIAANAVEAIPYFSGGLKGVARGCTPYVYSVSIMTWCKIVKGIRPDVPNVVHADEFEYKDPVDGSISKQQGTGSEGATIRLYVEQYEKDRAKTGRESQEALAPLVKAILKLSKNGGIYRAMWPDCRYIDLLPLHQDFTDPALVYTVL
ncbi:phosphoglucomutase, cytoplasmic-like [Rhodamnia argentea]|uniref:Phosphoglucomutase, cytoplasmic-like n=1 Tax=Rhodamnia argentea TaxID=178133 RepID=A0ABM3HEI8_9MYRT|nr:phosphoglucomutase, cytoplasmic-like [Rhodamnia argentea]